MGMKILPLPEGMTPPKPGPNTVVARPTARQLAVFGQQRQITCGTCKFFRRDTGQVIMRNTQFLQSLPEQGWKREHLCDDPQKMGLCDQHGDMIVGPSSLGCEFYKRDNR